MVAEDETSAAPAEAPSTPHVENTPEGVTEIATTPTPVAPAENASASAMTSAADAAAALVDEVRQRIVRANYGVSASVGITLQDRGDHGLLLFEANDHQEGLRAASAALATTPDDDARGWRFVGSGPDLDTGRYRAVVRMDGPPPTTASQPTESVVRTAPE